MKESVRLLPENLYNDSDGKANLAIQIRLAASRQQDDSGHQGREERHGTAHPKNFIPYRRYHRLQSSINGVSLHSFKTLDSNKNPSETE